MATTYVSARFWTGFLRTLVLQRIDVDDLVGDLPVEAPGDGRRGALVEWDAVIELAERLERRLGGPEALEELGAAIIRSRPMPALRRLAGWTASPSSLYRFALRWLALHAPRDFTTGIDVLDDGRLEVRVVVPEAARPGTPLFMMLAGAARALPVLLDLPDAVVDARVGAHSARFQITPPQQGTWLARLRRSLRTLLGSNRAIEQLEHEQHLLRRQIDVLEQSLVETTEREARLRTLTQASNELLLEIGEDGRIRSASDSAAHLTGYLPSQIVGSHLTLWFHRDDEERTRRFLSDVFAGDDSLAIDRVRARHERGEWLDTTLEARRAPASDGPHTIVVALREALIRDHGLARAELEARLQRLERRHRDLRDLQSKLFEAERTTVARDVGDMMERTVGAPLRTLVDDLEAHAHLAGDDPGALARIVDRARRMEHGLDRSLDVLRRAKLERSSCPIARIVGEFESILEARLDLDGVELRARTNELSGSARVDGALLAAAFDHIAEHLAQRVASGESVEMEVGGCSDRSALRIALWPELDAPDLHAPGAAGADPDGDARIPFDLELARGLLREHGGDLTLREGAPGQMGVELTLPIEP